MNPSHPIVGDNVRCMVMGSLRYKKYVLLEYTGFYRALQFDIEGQDFISALN